MPQNTHFSADFYKERRKPRGPLPFLNPTRSYYPLVSRLPGIPRVPIYHAWRSRDNRKGRHAAVLGAEHLADERVGLPARTDTWRETARGLWKMVVRYPVWDISYDVAVSFTIGMESFVLSFLFSCSSASSSAFFPTRHSFSVRYSRPK